MKTANSKRFEEEELTELAFDRLTKTANLATANASEEDKIEAMMEQSKEGFDPRLYQKSVPFNYTCHRCGKKGHHVKSCPTIGDSRFNTKITNNRPSGIPKEFFLRKIQHETEIIKRLRDLQDKNSRFSPVVGSDLVDQSKVPAELQCPMCKRLFTDVVVTPCCGDSYCDECIRNYLVENDIVCVCGETTSPDNLIANKSLRNSVNNFRNQKKSDMKSVPPSPVSQTTSSGMTDVVSQPTAVATSIESQPSPQPVIKVEPAVTQHQQPPDTNSENSQNGTTSISNVPSPAVPDITDSPKKPVITEKPDIAPDGKLVLSADPKTLLVSQGAPVLQSAPVVASIHQPGLITGGSIAAQVLPGSSIAGGQNVIYTHGAQTSLRHPGYTNYISRQPVIPGQPGLLPGAIQYGLNLAPGTTIVKRLVPVPVGPPRIGLPQSNIIRYTATPIARQVPPDLLPTEPNIERPLPHEPNRHHNERYKRDEPRVPMTEDEFYLWQQQAKKRSSRHRRRSASPDSNRYRSRSRSRTPTDKRRRRRNDVYEDSGEDSGLDKLKSREKVKKKTERRHRDSSQDSVQNEKIRSRAKKKKERHIPEHIKRELDEFEFDNEVEFDEELRKIKKRAKLKAKKMKKEQSPESSSSEDNESTKEELVSPERQTEEDSTLASEKRGSGSPEEKMEEPLNEEKTEDSVIAEENDNLDGNSPAKDTQVEEDLPQEKVNESEETDVKDHNNEESIENKENKEVPPSDGQKKKKTKIIKRKVVRVVKVRRKKSTVEQNSGEVAKPDDSNDSNLQNSGVTAAQQTNDQQSVEQESADKEIKSEPKRKIPQLPDHFKSPTKKLRTISYEVKNEAEALLEKRKAKKKLLAAKLEKIANNSPSKVEAAAAAVRAKKEAEKKALLEKAKRAQRIKEARELKEAKSIEEEEKRRRREKYILAKQKKLKEKEKLKHLEGDVLSIEDKKLQRKLTKQQEETKKPDQQFYKPGEAKLKTLSEMTKQRLKQSEGEHKKRTNEGDETGESDVLKSKVTSLHKVISPDKNRKMIKTSVSEEEKEYSKSQLSQSVEEISHRRIVKLADSKRKNLSSRVEKLERNEKGKETSESHRVRKDSSDHTDSLERLRIERRRQREEDEQRRDAKEKKRRQLEKEREDRKRLQALEKEKQESYERERQAIREKEKLERKLQQEREIFEQMLRIKQLEKEKSKRLLEHRKYGKRKSSEESEEEATSKSRKNKKIDKKKPNYIIQIMDSENEKSESDVNESESSSEESEKEKKRKRKSKKKKEKRKSKKKRQVSEDEDEEDSNNTSDEDEEENERKKKKKKKHKRNKHKKHRKSRKHKKKSKKRKARRKESSSGSESEDNEEDEEATEDSKDKDEETEESEKQSDKEKTQKNTKKKSKPSSSESSEEESIDEDNEERKTETETESKVDESSDTGKAERDDDKMTEENQRKLKSEMSEMKTESEVRTTKEVDSSKAENSKKEEKFSKVVKRRETLEGDEIELDYNEDELDNEALYGDLNFADDEQTNPNIKTVNEPRNKEEDVEEVEEGEIPDEDVFEPSLVNNTFNNEKETDKSTEESLDLNKSDVDIDDIYDTDIEKAVTDAINELSKEKMTKPEKSELSDEIENVSITTGKS